MKDVLQRSVDTWGPEEQWRMVQEECAELIAAINRMSRGRPDAREKVVEEVVDVWIVIHQARLMLDREGTFNKILEQKLSRLKYRLDVEAENRAAGLPHQKDVGLMVPTKEPT